MMRPLSKQLRAQISRDIRLLSTSLSVSTHTVATFSQPG